MGILKSIFGRKLASAPKADEAVIVYIDAVGQPDEVYENFDLSTLEDQLIEAIESAGVGELDGNELGDGVTKLFMYGPDAARLYNAIEPVLLAYPLCKGARVVIRKGGPGSAQTEVKL
jgi:hypothetical protein